MIINFLAIFTKHFRIISINFLAILLIFCQDFSLSHKYSHLLQNSQLEALSTLDSNKNFPLKNSNNKSTSQNHNCLICYFSEFFKISFTNFANLFILSLIILAIFLNQKFTFKRNNCKSQNASRAPPKLA